MKLGFVTRNISHYLPAPSLRLGTTRMSGDHDETGPASLLGSRQSRGKSRSQGQPVQPFFILVGQGRKCSSFMINGVTSVSPTSWIRPRRLATRARPSTGERGRRGIKVEEALAGGKGSTMGLYPLAPAGQPLDRRETPMRREGDMRSRSHDERLRQLPPGPRYCRLRDGQLSSRYRYRLQHSDRSGRRRSPSSARIVDTAGIRQLTLLIIILSCAAPKAWGRLRLMNGVVSIALGGATLEVG